MAFELANYAEPFVEVTVATFKEFVGIEPSPGRPYFMAPEQVNDWDISAVIGLSGLVKGAVIVSMKAELAVKLTDMLAGPGHKELDADVIDAVGEINNIIAGNIKPKIPNGEKIIISIPMIIKGKEQPSFVWPGSQTRILCIPHKVFDNEIFHLMVAIEESEK